MEILYAIQLGVLGLYAASSTAYAFLLSGRLPSIRLPLSLFLSAVLGHTIELILRGAEAGAAGGAPFVGLSGFVSIYAYLVALIFLALAFYHRVHALGAFYLPVVFVLQGISAAIYIPITTIPKLKTGTVLICHIVTNAIAYAAFAVAFVASVAFILLERQIRRKRFGNLMQRLPNLDLVETVNTQSVFIGLVLLIIGAGTGIVMGYREWGNYHSDPKNWMTYLIIAVFAVQMLLRRFAGFSGRRSQHISILGFIMVLCGFTVINLFFSPLHGTL